MVSNIMNLAFKAQYHSHPSVENDEYNPRLSVFTINLKQKDSFDRFISGAEAIVGKENLITYKGNEKPGDTTSTEDYGDKKYGVLINKVYLDVIREAVLNSDKKPKLKEFLPEFHQSEIRGHEGPFPVHGIYLSNEKVASSLFDQINKKGIQPVDDLCNYNNNPSVGKKAALKGSNDDSGWVIRLNQGAFDALSKELGKSVSKR